MEEITVPSERSPARDIFLSQNDHDRRVPDGLGGQSIRDVKSMEFEQTNFRSGT